MHNSPSFEMTNADDKIAFVKQRRFANLVVNGPDAPIIAHLPMMIIHKSNGELYLEGHVARSNHIATAAKDAHATAIFNGPDAYIAAGFYPSKQIHGKVAPTWNYMAVHCSGPVETFSDGDELVEHLDRLTVFLEADEKAPWAVDDAPEGFTERLVRAIIGIRIQINLFEGIAKLNQNSNPADRKGVIAGLAERDANEDHRIVEEMSN